jgi:hypothetical protein
MVFARSFGQGGREEFATLGIFGIVNSSRYGFVKPG